MKGNTAPRQRVGGCAACPEFGHGHLSGWDGQFLCRDRLRDQSASGLCQVSVKTSPTLPWFSTTPVLAPGLDPLRMQLAVNRG